MTMLRLAVVVLTLTQASIGIADQLRAKQIARLVLGHQYQQGRWMPRWRAHDTRRASLPRDTREMKETTTTRDDHAQMERLRSMISENQQQHLQEALAKHPVPQLDRFAHGPVLGIAPQRRRGMGMLKRFEKGFGEADTTSGILVVGPAGNGRKRFAAHLAQKGAALRKSPNDYYPHVIVDLGALSRMNFTDEAGLDVATSIRWHHQLKQSKQPYMIFVTNLADLAPVESPRLQIPAVEQIREMWRAEVTQALENSSAFVVARIDDHSQIDEEMARHFSPGQTIRIDDPDARARRLHLRFRARQEKWRGIDLKRAVAMTEGFSRRNIDDAINFSRDTYGAVTRKGLEQGVRNVVDEGDFAGQFGFAPPTNR